MINVLFVCLGNICRSPMAEGVLKKMIKDMKLEDQIFCDSAGTSSYHIGELADTRTRNTAEKYDIFLDHRARQLIIEDFNKFDYILAMDRKNYHNINLLSETSIPTHHYEIMMMRDFDSIKDSEDVPDPYFGGMDGFEEVKEILFRSNEAFLNFLIKKHDLL
jgi:protein-tyrosine phosphatase